MSDDLVVQHANGAKGTPRNLIKSIYTGKKVKNVAVPFRLGEDVYKIEYQSRKKFTLSRLELKKTKHRDGKISEKYQTIESITVWDIIAAYGCAFVDALTSFKIVTDLEEMKRMKAARKTFTIDMLPEVTKYCLSECEWGAKLYRTTLDYACDKNLLLSRHDGGGAFAAAMLKLEGVSEHLPSRKESVNDQETIDSIRRAFFGGRIENGRIGLFENLREYDLNSAYPSIMVGLPSMIGSWSNHEGPPVEIDPSCLYLVKVIWNFDPGLHFYPLPYRNDFQQVLFPSSGAGEYWLPEYQATLRWCERFGQELPEVVSYRKFTPSDPEARPLAFVEKYYAMRLADKERIGMVIKICINSGYGKFAQQLGGTKASATTELVLPPFFCQEWAGMITSGTRAKLLEAACLLKDPTSLVGFATDAVLVLEPLDIATPGKKLGDWDVPGEYERAVVIQAGVRYTYNAGKWKGKTRGFPLRALPTPEPILEAWKRGEKSITVKVDRFYAFSSAILGDDMWEKRGQWEECEREIDVTGKCPKRLSNAEIYEEGDSEVSWRTAEGEEFKTCATNVTLPATVNLFYEEGARSGHIRYSVGYENLESIQSKSVERQNTEFIEE
jgi:hypothetical protein